MDDFELFEELGKGNYGTVQKVWHKPTKVTMALKVSSLFSTSGGYRGPSPHVSLSEQSQTFDTGLVSLSERPQSSGHSPLDS